MALAELARRVRPVSLAGEQRLEVIPALSGLVPGGGIRRGSTTSVSGGRAGGATSLAVALLSRATAEGSWCAVVGVPELGLVTAAELGVDLSHLALVPAPEDQWMTVVAALLDGVDVVLVRFPRRVRVSDVRRLAARARERGAALVVLSGETEGSRAVPRRAWPEVTDVGLAVTASRWTGLGNGHGRLGGRLVEVVAEGRGAAARSVEARLWLPSPQGEVVLEHKMAVGLGPAARPAAGPAARPAAGPAARPAAG
jgi:hypothetical protein